MHTDVKSRGFSLTPAMKAAVDCEVRDYAKRFPKLTVDLAVRLFDVNGLHGALDKGCLVHARVGQRQANVVASELDADLCQAIRTAFSKLERSTRTVLGRGRVARYEPGGRRAAQYWESPKSTPIYSGN